MNLAFAKIPMGWHTVFACIAGSVVGTMLSLIIRACVKSITPFELSFLGILTILLMDILFGMIKLIPVKDKRTGQIKKWQLGSWLHMPASHRFNLKSRAAVKLNIRTTQVAAAFAFAYPLLGGLFFQSGIL